MTSNVDDNGPEQADQGLGHQIFAVSRDGDLIGEVVTTETGVEARIGSARSAHASLDDALAALPALRTFDGESDWVITSDLLPAWKLAEKLSGDTSGLVINDTIWLSWGDGDIRWVPEDPWEEQEGYVEGAWFSYASGWGPGSPGGSPQFDLGVHSVGDLGCFYDYEAGNGPEWFRVEQPFTARYELFARSEHESRYMHAITDPSLGDLDGDDVSGILGSPDDYEWTPMTINGIDWKRDKDGEGWTRA